ncbi:MAG: hypothetical protein ABUT39_25375 [Acidobacteriota bacterium]
MRRTGTLLALVLCLTCLACAKEMPGPATAARPVETPAEPADSRLARLPGSSPLEVFPSFSPKGDLLAFSSDASGSPEIHVRRLAGDPGERALTSDGQQNIQPTWSPDGKRIAYCSNRRGGIWVVPVRGGRPKRLSDFGSNPAWSPDGSAIVFQSDPFGELSLFAYPALPPSNLWLVPADGGAPRQLTKPGDPPGGHGAPSWSPDGKRIVFASSTLWWGKLWTMSASGGDFQLLDAALRPREPVYSPDGQTLYYSGPDPKLGFTVFSIPVAGGKPTPIQSAPARDLALSPDGKKLAFSHMDLDSLLWAVPISPETARPTGPAKTLTTDPKGRESRPAFSPDGKRIAFIRYNPQNLFELSVINNDGSDRVLLTDQGTFAGGQPIWMPGGRQLAFLSRAQGPAATWTRIDIDTREQVTVAKPDPASSWTRLSPDGLGLAFELADKENRVNTWVQSPLDAAPRQITSDPEFAGGPMWSPAGDLLAVRIRRGPENHLGVVPPGGGALKQITSGINVVSQPGWSPDGSRLVFAGSRDGFWNLWWVSRDGGPIHPVTDLPKKFNLYLRYPDWSPAGDRIVYEYGESLGQLWTLDLCPGFSAACEESAPAAPSAPSAPEAARVQLTNTPGELEVFPALSPDGDLLAYSSDRTGAHEIYVRRRDGQGRERQITSDGRHNLQADWSPDGRFLAYHSVRSGGIWVVPAGGGQPRRLTDFGSDPAWSPDGRTIAFQSAPVEALSLYAFPAMPPSTLWLVSAEGGAPRQLTRPAEPSGGHGAPAWTSDGQRIAFTSNEIGSFGSLWSISAQGDDLRLVQGVSLPRDPLYTPGNRSLLFSSPDADRGFRFGVYRIPVEGGKPEIVSTLPARHLTLSPDGCRIVVSEMGLAGNLWTLPLSPQSGEPAGPATPFTRDPDDRNSQPTFSPDGKRIALHRVIDGSRFQIWLTDLDGRSRTFLTREATYGAGPPVWLPDNRHLVFLSRPEAGRMLLKKIDVETRKIEPYVNLDPTWSWIRLSPEGRRVAFARPDETSVANLWILPSLDAKEPKQLTFDKESADFPMWSPDGKYLAVRLRRGEDTQIGVVSAETGEVTQLTSGRGESWLPSWSPDGGRIAFAGMRDGIWNIYWVARTGGPVHKMTSQPDNLSTWVRYPVWYPAGDRIIFEHSKTLGDLWQLSTCAGGTPEKMAR